MLTDAFYTALTTALRDTRAAAGFSIAVGTGAPEWDRRRPAPARATAALVAEIARKMVAPGDVAFVDAAGDDTGAEGTRLRFTVTFAPDEAVGTLRECGLFAGTGQADGRVGALLSYFTHAAIAKTDGMVLARTITVDLTPRAAAAAPAATRFLGNVNQRELHDLENVTPRCQIDEIRVDRRFFFATVEDAQAMGYDLCAYCFGRALSQR